MHGNDFSLVYENTDEVETEYINETPDYVKEEIEAWNKFMDYIQKGTPEKYLKKYLISEEKEE